MQLTFTKATKAKVKARVAIDGPSGAGKTYSALILATVLANGGKIAVIDTERGSASLYSDKFDFDVLELDTFSPALYTQAITAAEEAGYQVIVIDSLSHAWEGEGGALDQVDQKATQIKGNSYVAWKDVTPMHRRMVDAMLQSKAHIVVTMRSKMEYVQEKNEKGNTVIRKVGMAPIQRQGMEYEFTIVADMDVDHHISISKSRCEEMADKVALKPGGDFWKTFTVWLNTGEEKKPTPQQVKAPAPQPANPVPPEYTEAEEDARWDGSNIVGNAVPLRYNPAALRARIQELADAYAKSGKTANAGQRGLCAASLDQCFSDDTGDRHALNFYLTGKESSKDMEDAEILALLKWLEPTKDASGKYWPNGMSVREANAAVRQAMTDKGQQELM